jgi:hypothetical protein
MLSNIVSRVNSFVGSLKKEINEIVGSPAVPLVSSIGYPPQVANPPTPPLATDSEFDSVVALNSGDDFCDISGNGYFYRHKFGVWQICTKAGLVRDLTLDVSGNAYWTDLSGCAHFVPNPFGQNSSYFAGATVQTEKSHDFCDFGGRYYTQNAAGGWQIRFDNGAMYPLVLDTSGGATWIDVSGGCHFVPSPFGVGSGLYAASAPAPSPSSREARSQCTAACDCVGGACIKSCSNPNLRLLDVEEAGGMDCDKGLDCGGKLVCDGGVCYIRRTSTVALSQKSMLVSSDELCKDGIDCECTNVGSGNMVVD